MREHILYRSTAEPLDDRIWSEWCALYLGPRKNNNPSASRQPPPMFPPVTRSELREGYRCMHTWMVPTDERDEEQIFNDTLHQYGDVIEQEELAKYWLRHQHGRILCLRGALDESPGCDALFALQWLADDKGAMLQCANFCAKMQRRMADKTGLGGVTQDIHRMCHMADLIATLDMSPHDVWEDEAFFEMRDKGVRALREYVDGEWNTTGDTKERFDLAASSTLLHYRLRGAAASPSTGLLIRLLLQRVAEQPIFMERMLAVMPPSDADTASTGATAAVFRGFTNEPRYRAVDWDAFSRRAWSAVASYELVAVTASPIVGGPQNLAALLYGLGVVGGTNMPWWQFLFMTKAGVCLVASGPVAMILLMWLGHVVHDRVSTHFAPAERTILDSPARPAQRPPELMIPGSPTSPTEPNASSAVPAASPSTVPTDEIELTGGLVSSRLPRARATPVGPVEDGRPPGIDGGTTPLSPRSRSSPPATPTPVGSDGDKFPGGRPSHRPEPSRRGTGVATTSLPSRPRSPSRPATSGKGGLPGGGPSRPRVPHRPVTGGGSRSPAASRVGTDEERPSLPLRSLSAAVAGPSVVDQTTEQTRRSQGKRPRHHSPTSSPSRVGRPVGSSTENPPPPARPPAASIGSPPGLPPALPPPTSGGRQGTLAALTERLQSVTTLDVSDTLSQALMGSLHDAVTRVEELVDDAEASAVDRHAAFKGFHIVLEQLKERIVHHGGAADTAAVFKELQTTARSMQQEYIPRASTNVSSSAAASDRSASMDGPPSTAEQSPVNVPSAAASDRSASMDGPPSTAEQSPVNVPSAAAASSSSAPMRPLMPDGPSPSAPSRTTEGSPSAAPGGSMDMPPSTARSDTSPQSTARSSIRGRLNFPDPTEMIKLWEKAEEAEKPPDSHSEYLEGVRRTVAHVVQDVSNKAETAAPGAVEQAIAETTRVLSENFPRPAHPLGYAWKKVERPTLGFEQDGLLSFESFDSLVQGARVSWQNDPTYVLMWPDGPEELEEICKHKSETEGCIKNTTLHHRGTDTFWQPYLVTMAEMLADCANTINAFANASTKRLNEMELAARKQMEDAVLMIKSNGEVTLTNKDAIEKIRTRAAAQREATALSHALLKRSYPALKLERFESMVADENVHLPEDTEALDEAMDTLQGEIEEQAEAIKNDAPQTPQGPLSLSMALPQSDRRTAFFVLQHYLHHIRYLRRLCDLKFKDPDPDETPSTVSDLMNWPKHAQYWNKNVRYDSEASDKILPTWANYRASDLYKLTSDQSTEFVRTVFKLDSDFELREADGHEWQLKKILEVTWRFIARHVLVKPETAGVRLQPAKPSLSIMKNMKLWFILTAGTQADCEIPLARLSTNKDLGLPEEKITTLEMSIDHLFPKGLKDNKIGWDAQNNRGWHKDWKPDMNFLHMFRFRVLGESPTSRKPIFRTRAIEINHTSLYLDPNKVSVHLHPEGNYNRRHESFTTTNILKEVERLKRDMLNEAKAGGTSIRRTFHVVLYGTSGTRKTETVGALATSLWNPLQQVAQGPVRMSVSEIHAGEVFPDYFSGKNRIRRPVGDERRKRPGQPWTMDDVQKSGWIKSEKIHRIEKSTVFNRHSSRSVLEVKFVVTIQMNGHVSTLTLIMYDLPGLEDTTAVLNEALIRDLRNDFRIVGGTMGVIHNALPLPLGLTWRKVPVGTMLNTLNDRGRAMSERPDEVSSPELVEILDGAAPSGEFIHLTQAQLEGLRVIRPGAYVRSIKDNRYLYEPVDQRFVDHKDNAADQLCGKDHSRPDQRQAQVREKGDDQVLPMQSFEQWRELYQESAFINQIYRTLIMASDTPSLDNALDEETIRTIFDVKPGDSIWCCLAIPQRVQGHAKKSEHTYVGTLQLLRAIGVLTDEHPKENEIYKDSFTPPQGRPPAQRTRTPPLLRQNGTLSSSSKEKQAEAKQARLKAEQARQKALERGWGAPAQRSKVEPSSRTKTTRKDPLPRNFTGPVNPPNEPRRFGARGN